MRFFLSFFAVLAALALAPPRADAQNLSLAAPDWAQTLVAADVIPTTGGRAELNAPGVAAAARVTIAPGGGGVARVIRYEAPAGALSLRRFVGHHATGWWLWGSDAPVSRMLTAAEQRALAGLIRNAARADEAAGERCAGGEHAYVEIVHEGRGTAFERACVSDADAVGRLVLRLSELGGSRTEDELIDSGEAEVLAADRAFAAMAAAQGVAAAFAHYAADDALIVTGAEIIEGRDAVIARYARWPEGARLEWAPERARVSMRGDMAWTWGNSVYVAPDGARTPGRYVSIWTRHYDGAWRYAFDAPIR